ncbi:hypothetical protein RRG08_032684 [Elysia crispata]|uniref:Uncharacterized protein n=1 Tax=Elysia crispata TaxID=231223 RepID=A0AAE1CQ25_9GAST|nr:hypothetical protein RRG08_032684 [Elysia crispata]
MGNIVMSIVWLLLLLFIAWPVAFFIGSFWVFLQPFMVCLKLHDLQKSLLTIVDLPTTCTQKMMAGEGFS